MKPKLTLLHPDGLIAHPDAINHVGSNKIEGFNLIGFVHRVVQSI